MNATLTDLYAALKQAVMFSPQYVAPDSGNGKVWKCRQLQTWRVMQKERGAELATTNLGATICDKTKPFFWSRKWHESKYNPNNIGFEYPALLLTELSLQPEKVFQKSAKTCYNFQLAVVDQLVSDCADCGCDGCTGRVVSEIHDDTKSLLYAVLYYVSQIREATLEPSGETVFMNTRWLDYLKSAGEISAWNGGKDFGGILNGQTVSAYRIAVEAAKVYGTAVNFQVCFQDCEATEYDFNLPDFGVLAKEAGCKNCG